MSVYTHEMCDICDAPQWVMPNGEHRCMTIEQLQKRYEMDTDAFGHLQKYINDLERRIDICKAENDVLRQLFKESMDSSKNFGKT